MVDAQAGEDFYAGARWALSVAFDQLFGGLLGPELLEQATQLEEYRFGQWVPLA